MIYSDFMLGVWYLQKIFSIFMILILLTSVVSIGSIQTIHAQTPMELKQNAISELQTISDDNAKKKSVKHAAKAIDSIEQGLHSDFWLDDTQLNIQNGDTAMKHDSKAISHLSKIIKNKKESQNIKDTAKSAIEKILNANRALTGSFIDSAMNSLIDTKAEKKLDKAKSLLKKADEKQDAEKFSQSMNQYEKIWKQIQNALKKVSLQMEKGKTIELFNLEFNDPERLPDLFVKVKKSGNSFDVNVKIKDSCVDGITHDAAGMKLGFTVDGIPHGEREWLTEGFTATNKWFSNIQNDPNQQIDLVELPFGTVPAFGLPLSGDDIIQKNTNEKNGSFKHKAAIKQISEQSGWSGKYDFSGPEGDYLMHIILPAGGDFAQPCDNVSAVSIPITIHN